MCFSGEMSAGFAALGLFAAWWVYSRTSNVELAGGILFFFTMELLQAVQYYFIAPDLPHANTCSGNAMMDLRESPCDTYANKLLTLLGFLHICFQPYFCHVINSSLTKSCKYKGNGTATSLALLTAVPSPSDRYRIIKRLCLLGGCLLFLRYYLSFFPSLNTADLRRHPSTEWLRGPTLCTFKTKSMLHLGWSVPMADPSYFVVGASIHSFLMFGPFFVLYEKKGMILQGIFLFAFGPLLAALLTDNLMEQASIWCFFSIAQIAVMLFLIRETLLVNWGRDGAVSVLRADEDEEVDEDGERICRDFKNCEYCEEENMRRRMLRYQQEELQKEE